MSAPLLNPTRFLLAAIQGREYQIRFEQKHGVWFWMSRDPGPQLWFLQEGLMKSGPTTVSGVSHYLRSLKIPFRFVDEKGKPCPAPVSEKMFHDSPEAQKQSTREAGTAFCRRYALKCRFDRESSPKTISCRPEVTTGVL